MSSSLLRPRSPAATGGGRAVGLVFGWLIYALGVGLMGLPVFIFVFGAPVDVGLAFAVAAVVDVALAVVLIVAMRLSRRGRPGYAYGGWIMLAADVVLVAGFVAAYALVVAIAV